MNISKNKLQLAMIKAGITSSKELADAAGMSVNTISRILNGGSPTLTTVGKLANVLSIDPAELIEKEGAL